MTLDCQSSAGLICTEANGLVVNIGEYEDVAVKFYIDVPANVAVKFYIDVPANAAPGQFTLFVLHDGDVEHKSPIPYALQIIVPDHNAADPLPFCETALPVNCQPDPRILLPNHPNFP